MLKKGITGLLKKVIVIGVQDIEVCVEVLKKGR